MNSILIYKNYKISPVFLFFSLVLTVFLAQSAKAIDDNPVCFGMTDVCNQSCFDSRSVSDTDYSYIWSAWRGSLFSWDDDASYTIGYSGPGSSWSYSDYAASTNNRGWVCGCGDGSGCPGTSWPPPWTFFHQGWRDSGGKFTVYATINALQKRDKDVNPYRGEVAFGYAVVNCLPGEVAQFPPNSGASCATVLGNISASQSSCPAGNCNVTINWSATGKDTTWVYLNSGLWAQGGLSGSKDASSALNSLGPGVYTFGLRANDGYDTEWSLSGYLSTATVTVTPPSVTCDYSGSTGDFCVGDTGSWTISSNPTGYNIDNRGTKNGVTDDGDGGIIGTTNLSYQFTFVDG
jgi:hypothetical protein